MKSLFLIISFLFFERNICNAQEYPLLDSLKNELRKDPAPPVQVGILRKLCENYWALDLDSAFKYGEEALSLARQIGDTYNEAWLWSYSGGGYLNMGKYPESFQSLFGALKFGIANKYPDQTVNTLALIGAAYADLKDFRQAINYYDQGLETSNKIQSAGGVVMLELLKATAYRNDNQLDLASKFIQKAVAGNDTLKNPFLERTLFAELGIIQFRKGDHTNAFKNLHKSISIDKSENDHRALAIAYNHLAEIFCTMGSEDSSLMYAKRALQEAQRNGYKREILRSSKLLAELYDQRDIKEALHYLKMSNATNEEMFGAYKAIVLQRTLADEQERQSQAELEKIAYRNRLRQYAFLAGLGVLILVAVLLYRNNLREKKAKNQLQEKNKVIDRTLSDLRSTQTQLIQSAKMASLGELSAGIAHEIQNPLNFVNNFSEVNKELIEELKGERLKADGERNKDLEEQLWSDLNQNLEKINQHGKRADSIVKGMLQHSRSSSGHKEPTDINALADEYLRLSYHGMRAKDKTLSAGQAGFNATLQTDFEKRLDKISIIPQDIGRVLVNLYNNAFYAIGERMKVEGLGYEPTILVTTKKTNGKINITVRDNGTGIPEKIKDKIFQPFFTTKPTGQGTGLGLSLSYDIVKAHGGEISVNSKEGEGAEFIIQLPVT